MILLCGKSASGKDTLQKELIKMGYKSVVSYTTRPPRKGEVDGVAYNFISEEEFLQKEQEGFFAETTSYNVASGETWYYGAAIEDLTSDKVFIINPEGLRQVRKMKTLNPIAFYIMADEETIWNRLRQRGDDAAEARRRLNADDLDFADIISNVDFCLRNDMGLEPDVMATIIHNIYSELKGK
jgi:guanylate kinase